MEDSGSGGRRISAAAMPLATGAACSLLPATCSFLPSPLSPLPSPCRCPPRCRRRCPPSCGPLPPCSPSPSMGVQSRFGRARLAAVSRCEPMRILRGRLTGDSAAAPSATAASCAMSTGVAGSICASATGLAGVISAGVSLADCPSMLSVKASPLSLEQISSAGAVRQGKYLT